MEKHDEIIVPKLGPNVWYTKDLGCRELRYKITEKGLLHWAIDTNHPVPFSGILYFSGTTTNKHKVKLGLNAELSVTLTREHEYRAHLTSGICDRIEKKVGSSWVNPFDKIARLLLDGFHYYFPPLSEWEP